VTERLYYDDSYLTEFRASVVDASPDRRRIYLDRTAFYPTSGGQPFDIGRLGGVQVLDVADEEDRIAHVLDAPLEGRDVSGTLDWKRRFDHMQQHTGQHLLSAVLLDLYNAATVGFHLGAEASTIDIAVAALNPERVRKAWHRANEIVFENRPVTVSYGHSSEDLGLRKASDREGLLRVVSIERLDRSACGGTHVRATGEIGPILIRKLERIRGNLRVEFLCGMRAVSRAQADYDALAAIGHSFSAALDDTPALVATQIEKVREMEKAWRRLQSEVALEQGRQLHADTPPGPDGLRRIVRRCPSIVEELRAEAQGFASGEKAAFLALAQDPPSVLLAVSKDSGIHAGEWLKPMLDRFGGRGGGSATMAQGSLPSRDALEAVADYFA
jgi:alanyl-tRNA synthetase